MTTLSRPMAPSPAGDIGYDADPQVSYAVKVTRTDYGKREDAEFAYAMQKSVDRPCVDCGAPSFVGICGHGRVCRGCYEVSHD